MDDVLDSAWAWIEIGINNAIIFLDTVLSPFHFMGPELLIFFLVLITIFFSRFFIKHYNTRRYIQLKQNFDYWFELRQVATNHADSQKGKAIAKNIDQAELNRAYYDFFFEGLLKSLITTWLPLFCTLSYVNRSFTPERMTKTFGRESLFMFHGHTVFPWEIPSIFWFFISLALIYTLIPVLKWIKKSKSI